MGEIPRIHRVDPSPPIAQHLRVARAGDHPERERKDEDEGQRDHVELHGEDDPSQGSAEGQDQNNVKPKFSQDPEIRLDIAV